MIVPVFKLQLPANCPRFFVLMMLYISRKCLEAVEACPPAASDDRPAVTLKSPPEYQLGTNHITMTWLLPGTMSE